MNLNHQTTTTSTVSYSMADVAYSFSADTANRSSMNAPHVFLDILFMHPRTMQVVNMRTIVSAHLLCQPKDVVETTVHHEIRKALSFPGAHSLQEDHNAPISDAAYWYNYA